jgi:hypothetical protein
MRSLVIFGSIGLFAWAAFVPPRAATIVAARDELSLVPNVAAIANTIDVDAAKNGATELLARKGKNAALSLTHSLTPTFLDSSNATQEPWERAIDQADDPDVQHNFIAIEHAKESDNMQACHDMDDAGDNLSSADWTAYCLARLAKSLRRCNQLPFDAVPNLQSLCASEFASETIFF